MTPETAMHIKEAGNRAEEFRRCGFHCSEAVLRGAAQVLEVSLDDAVLRASTGLRGGGGGYADRCGALEAGAILVGFLFGRVKPEEDNSCASQLVRWLHARFDRDLGSTACRLLRPMSHLNWSDDFSCGPVYRKGAELAAEAILTAHEICLTCPPFDLARHHNWRPPVDRDALRESLDRIHSLAEAQRLVLTDEARAAMVRLGLDAEEVSFSLATARRAHPAWGGNMVVEGRKPDRWYLTTLVRIRPDPQGVDVLEVLAVL